MKKIEIIPHGWLVVRYMYPYLSLLIIPLVKELLKKSRLSVFLSLEVLALLTAFTVAVIKRVKFRCIMTEDGIFVKSGLFIKKEYFVPTEKAAVVSVERNALLRIFNTATLKIYGSFGRKSERIVDIPITLRYAELVEKMYSIKPENEIYECGFLGTLLSSAADSSLSVGLFIALPIINLSGKIIGTSIKDMLLRELKETDYVIPNLIEKGVRILSLILIIGYAVSFLNAFLKNVNFKIFKDGDFLLIKAGILPRRSICFKSGDITAAAVRKSPVLRIIKKVSVMVSVGGYGTETRENCLLLPLVSEKTAKLFFEIYAPEVALSAPRIQHPKSSVLRFLRPPILIAVSSIVGFLVFGQKFPSAKTTLLYLTAFAVSVCVILTVLRYGFFVTGGMTVTEKNISVSSYGIFSERQLHFKTENAEMAQIKTTPFDRRLGLSRIKFFVFGKNRNRITLKNMGEEELLKTYCLWE